MKNLLVLVVVLFTVNISFAQEEISSPSDSQPKFTLKTSPFSNFWGNFKIAGDMAIDESSTLEAQIGLSSTFFDIPNSPHVQLRYKKDIIKDNKTLEGLYFAGGMEIGRWLDQEFAMYGSLLADLGYQFNVSKINMEVFGGLALTATDGEFAEGEAGCIGCGTVVQPNSLGIGSMGFRLGGRIGIAW